MEKIEKQRGRPRKDQDNTNLMTQEELGQALIEEEGKPKEQKPRIKTFEEATMDMEVGEFRLKKGYNKHYIHQNPLCKVKGRNGQRVVFEGDILLCPPYLIEAFRDKFERMDASDTKEEIEIKEKVKSPPTMHQKGKGKYDVMYDGMKINDQFLGKKQAEELIQAYAE